MSLQLQIINIPEGELLAETLYRLPMAGGLIGRAPTCNIPLPDNTRFLSSRHARVFQEDNQWLIEDLSTNGLLINNASAALGPGKRHTLTDGDILTCGEYRIMVNLFSPEVSLTSGIAEALNKAPLIESPTGDDPFSTSSASFGQATTMVLDDPFNDSSNDLPLKSSRDASRTEQSGQSVSFTQAEQMSTIDQLADAESNTLTSNHYDNPDLIDVLDQSPVSIPEQAENTEDFSLIKTTTAIAVEAVVETVVDAAAVETAADMVAEPFAVDPIQEPIFTSEPVHEPLHQPLPQHMQHPVSHSAQHSITTLPEPTVAGSPGETIYQLQEENRKLKEALRRKNRMVKKAIYHSMGQALEQTLMDFSPEYLEKLFDDYSGKKSFFRKRNNWQLYSRHFHRVVKDQTCRLAFTARFQAALRTLQEKNS